MFQASESQTGPRSRRHFEKLYGAAQLGRSARFSAGKALTAAEDRDKTWGRDTERRLCSGGWKALRRLQRLQRPANSDKTNRMSEEDLTKEQKLEAARKKFEELKKKNKKGKKKGKKSGNGKKEDSDVLDDDDATRDEGEENEENGEKAESGEAAATEGEAAKATSEEEGNDDVDVDVDAAKKPAEAAERIEESSAENTAEAGAPAAEKTEVTEVAAAESGVDGEAAAEPSQDAPAEEAPLESILSSSGNGESTFLTSSLQSTVAELQAEAAKLREEVRTLKAENVDLKLMNSDLEIELAASQNALETQKAQMERLTQQMRTARVDPAQHAKSGDEEDGVSVLSGTEYLTHATSSFQNLTSFNINNNSQDYMDIVDLKERLAQWKGWNMDMHGWRSIGMGPIVDI